MYEISLSCQHLKKNEKSVYKEIYCNHRPEIRNKSKNLFENKFEINSKINSNLSKNKFEINPKFPDFRNKSKNISRRGKCIENCLEL